MTKLFISYAHRDSDTVFSAAEELRGAGFDVWIDTRGIQAGDLWVEEITDAISECDVFVLFISERSVPSDYVRRELDLAFDAKKKMIPIRLDASELPSKWKYQLAGIQYIDFQFKGWKDRFVDAIRGEPKWFPPKPGQTGPLPPRTDTGKLRNPYASLPLLEPIERTLILSNRKEELIKATDQLDDHRLLVVTGMPGIGKSTFARALLDFRPDGSPIPFWYNFRLQQSSGNSLGILLERISGYLDASLNATIQQEVMSFRQSPGGNASASDVDVLISFLNQERPIWLVFDNLETVLSAETNAFLDDGLNLLFDSLKNNTHNARIIITNPFIPVLKSGEPLLEIGTRALNLQGLDSKSATEVLQAFGLNDLPGDTLTKIVSDSDGHPFILSQIAHYIQIFGVSAALENLQGGWEDVNERFGRTLQDRLSAQELNALRSLTILNREVSLLGLCQIARVKQGTIFRLREKGLLQTNDAGKFWLHNIVRNSLKIMDPKELHDMHLRAANFFRGQTVPELLRSLDDYAGVLEWHFHAVKAEDVVSAYAALYPTGLEQNLMKWNEYELLASLCEQTISAMYLAATNLIQIKANLSYNERIKIYHTLGIALFFLGDFLKSISYLTSAINLAHSQGDDELRIKLLIDLSESYNGNGDFKSAQDICQEVETLLSRVKNDTLQAKFLQLRGIINRDQGVLDKALLDLQEALACYENQMDHIHAINASVDLGVVYYRKNQYDNAVTIYKKVISLCKAIMDMRGMMIAHFNIGDIYLQEEQFQSATVEFQIALEIARKRKFSWMEAYAGLYLVEARIALMDLENARRELDLLKPVIMKQSSRCLASHEQALIASLHWKLKQIDLANTSFKQAFELFENANCEEQEARTHIAFASFMKEQGEFTSAKNALIRAKKIFTGLNNQLGLKAVEKTQADFDIIELS